MSDMPVPAPRAAIGGVSWSNFRSFRRADLDLRRITVLLGRNNSGKSSLHRPLTLLKQTLEIDSDFPGLYGRGMLVDCGGFSDCTFGSSLGPIVFRLQLDPNLSLWRHDEGSGEREQIDIGSIELSFTQGPPLNPFVLDGFVLRSPSGTRLLERRISEGGYDYHGLICKGNPPNSRLDRVLRAAIQAERPHHFVFTGSSIFTDAFRDFAVDETAPSDQVISRFSAKYIGVTQAVAEWLTVWLGRLTYLGPLRAQPQRTYRLGEFYSPSTSDGREVPEELYRVLDGEQGIYRGTADEFRSRLDRYMRMLGLRATVECEPLGEDSFSIYLREQGRKINIADSAFGYSQVLPLVVRSLLSRAGDTFIIEQPELHLNPALQSRLADLFVAAVSRRSTAIIETHSEHFINRLRTLVANEKLDPDDLAIYFVERGPKESRVRRVNVDELGALDASWPEGFFGDSLREAQALNRAQRARLRNG